jgi:signal transduction histidine kinase
MSQSDSPLALLLTQSTALPPAEAILQRPQEMLSQHEKLAAMSSLLASMAHELNNPLAVIMMQSELLLEETTDMALVERATHINDAAERCVHIVRNFLMLARQSSPERTQVQLNLVVAEALQLCAYALQLDNIDVSQQLADDLPALWADAQQLCQVVVNLLLNAHYALRETPTPRRLTLITRFDPVHHQAILRVADTGPGIPPEIQTRLFEPFFTTKPYRAMELRQVVQYTLQRLSEADCSAISHARTAISPSSLQAQGGGHG